MRILTNKGEVFETRTLTKAKKKKLAYWVDLDKKVTALVAPRPRLWATAQKTGKNALKYHQQHKIK